MKKDIKKHYELPSSQVIELGSEGFLAASGEESKEQNCTIEKVTINKVIWDED